ncbi:terminase large subunit domain-containing protein [Streptomyces sp. C-3]
MTETFSTETLPVPLDALRELGLSEDEIAQALASRPLVVAAQAANAPGAYFDVAAAHRAVDAIQSFKHTKGRWGNSRLKLSPWQIVWVIAPIFGWLAFDAELGRPVRVIRSVWCEVPRKSGKCTLSSGIGLVLLLADREIGAEVYAAAGSLPQAERVFDDAKRMALTSRAVRGRVEVLRGLIRVPRTGGIFRALSKIAETAHGLNVSGAIVDEVHVHKRRDLIDAIETGTGARDQPLIVYITTADEGVEGSIYNEKHVYTRRCADGIVDDPAHYGVIWAADESDGERSPRPAAANSRTFMSGTARAGRSRPSYAEPARPFYSWRTTAGNRPVDHRLICTRHGSMPEANRTRELRRPPGTSHPRPTVDHLRSPSRSSVQPFRGSEGQTGTPSPEGVTVVAWVTPNISFRLSNACTTVTTWSRTARITRYRQRYRFPEAKARGKRARACRTYWGKT